MAARERSPTQPPTRRVALEALVVWFALGTIYLLTLSGNHTEAEDALRYLYDIRSGDVAAIFNSYHLAYGWYGWLGYHAALLLGYGGGPLLPVQVLNALTGALGIAVLWVLLRTVVPGRAAAGCGLLAFSYGYWWYSVEVEVYILSAVLLICSLSLAYRVAMNPAWKSCALLGATHGFAVLAHNTNVLFVTVTAVALLYASRTLPLRSVVRLVLVYAGAGIVVVAPTYVLAMAASGLQTPEEVYEWLLPPRQGVPYGVWESSNVPKALVGIGRALVGGHFAFSLDPVHEIVDDGFSDKNLREELFLVRDFPEWLALLLLALIVVLALAFSLHVLAGLLGGTSLDDRGRLLAILCAAWLVPYVPFFAWWEPQNIEFWIAPWIPLAILFALGFSTRVHPPRRGFTLPPAGVIIVILFCVNLWGSVWPQHDPEDDYWRVRTSWYEHNALPSDLGVTAGALAERYVRYFGPREVINVETVFPKHAGTADAISALRNRLKGAHPRRVLFSSEAFYPASDKFSRCTNTRLCDEWAPAMREEFLPCARVLTDEPLKEVWMLERHKRRSTCD
jgi:hypothetical protein